MTIKDNCDQWINLSYDRWFGWLRNDKKKTYLRESTRNLVVRMQNASRDQNRGEEAWNLLERLKRLSDSFNKLEDVSKSENYKFERPETYLECALTAYRMGDLQESMRLFQVPIGEFQARSLHKAISYWIYGCVQWQLPAHLEDAVISWERSLYIMNEALSDNRNDLDIKQWSSQIIIQMKGALNDATRLNSPPAPPRENRASRTSRSEISSYQAKLKSFPIYGSIQAGVPAGGTFNLEEQTGINFVELGDGRNYEIYSLRGEKEIRILPGRDYYILQVKGDSMNLATPVNIDDGDYVLMLKRDIAVSGDIVAVEIIQEDEIATLKRFVFNDGEYKLRPESDNTELPPYIRLTKDFYIRGIALAVLKPNE